MDPRDGLQELRTVALASSVTEKVVDDISLRLLQIQLESNQPARLLIDSRGGHLEAGMKLHDIIAYMLTIPVQALVIGRCDSAATFPLLACKRRLALPHARFVIHSGTAGGITLRIDESTTHHLERLLAEMKEDGEMVTEFYMEKLGKSREEVQKLIQRGDEVFHKELLVADAKEIGLITDIVRENIGLFPSAESRAQ